MSSPRDFLESIEEGVTQNWQRACKLKGIAIEMISTQQLQGLSAVHSQGGADVLGLSPGECGSYGYMLTELGRAAEECRVSCRKLYSKMQHDVEAAVTTGLSQDASQVAQELGASWSAAVEAAQATQDMVAWMEQKSISTVVLLEKTDEEVAQMDCLEMENLYEKIRSQRHRAHAESCRGWAETVLCTGALPMEHAALQEQHRGAADLGLQAVALAQQRQQAKEVCQVLQAQQVDLAAKMQERMLTSVLRSSRNRPQMLWFMESLRSRFYRQNTRPREGRAIKTHHKHHLQCLHWSKSGRHSKLETFSRDFVARSAPYAVAVRMRWRNLRGRSCRKPVMPSRRPGKATWTPSLRGRPFWSWRP